MKAIVIIIMLISSTLVSQTVNSVTFQRKLNKKNVNKIDNFLKKKGFDKVNESTFLDYYNDVKYNIFYNFETDNKIYIIDCDKDHGQYLSLGLDIIVNKTNNKEPLMSFHKRKSMYISVDDNNETYYVTRNTVK